MPMLTLAPAVGDSGAFHFRARFARRPLPAHGRYAVPESGPFDFDQGINTYIHLLSSCMADACTASSLWSAVRGDTQGGIR
jgi:hypothetical protein